MIWNIWNNLKVFTKVSMLLLAYNNLFPQINYFPDLWTKKSGYAESIPKKVVPIARDSVIFCLNRADPRTE